MTAIQLAGLTKRFGDVTAVDGIDLDIADGEHVAVLGPSGSGKSTLLRVIAGLEESDEGTVAYDGVSQHGVPPHRRDAAIVFQHFALYPHLSSLENITLGLRHGLGLSRRDAEARAREVAARMQVEHLLSRKPKAMSGGQRQRIALARALARRSGIVLLDEPLSGLDAQLHAALRLEIASLLRSFGATGVNVTHDQLDAMAMADRIAVIRDGRIEQVGTPDELYAEPRTTFVASFIGTPPMNLVRIGDDGRSAFGDHGGASAGMVLGVRAEDLTLTTVHGATSEWILTGVVGLVEPTGRDRIVRLVTQEGVAVAFRCDLSDAPTAGDQITIECRATDVHVYATDPGHRLGTAASAGIGLSSPLMAG